MLVLLTTYFVCCVYLGGDSIGSVPHHGFPNMLFSVWCRSTVFLYFSLLKSKGFYGRLYARKFLIMAFLACVRRKSSLSIDLDIYFRLFIMKNAENSACQEDEVAAIFDFVTVGLVVVLCLTSRTFRQIPHHHEGYFGPWTFRPKSTWTQSLDISCQISGHFEPALVCSNQNLGNCWQVYGCLNIEPL